MSGATSKKIARDLGIGNRTVEIHRSHVLHKLGAKNTIDLIRKALTRADEARRIAANFAKLPELVRKDA